MPKNEQINEQIVDGKKKNMEKHGKIRRQLPLLIGLLIICGGYCCSWQGHQESGQIPNREGPVEQVVIDRVESMPSMPQPYKIIDWKRKAIRV